MIITSSYAALLAILFVFLSFRTIRLRRKLKIGVGDSGNTTLLRAMRVHANFSEYVPLALLLIYFVELKNVYPLITHGLGVILVIGRIFHAYGVSQVKENFKFRVLGMIMTFIVILSSSAYLLISNFIF